MAQVTFNYEGINIGVLARDECDIQWLKEFLTPWFEVSGDDADVLVRVSVDPALFAQLMACGRGEGSVDALMMDTTIITFPRWNVPGEQLVFYDEDRDFFYRVNDSHVELVLRERDADIRTRLMRVLREQAMGVAQLRGGRFLHASAFALDGAAAIITGPRQAGKTSLLSYMLSNSAAQFLANDRLLVRREQGSLLLRGMPTIVSIREGTMDLFPEIRRRINDCGFASGRTMREARQQAGTLPQRTKEDSRGVSPRQFCSIMDCQPVCDARAGVLIFPRQTGRAGGLQLRLLRPDESEIRLRDCLFGHIGPSQLSQAFTTLPHRLGREIAPDDTSLLQGLAGAVPAYDCELGNEAYAGAAGASHLLQVLQSAQDGLPHSGPTVAW